MSVANTHFGASKIEQLLNGKKSIFFVGIGGINMSSLAHVTKTSGFRVGGSDRVRSALTERLEEEGIEIFYSHSADNINGYDALVYTVAIGEDNPEYLRAIQEGKPCISRADYMGYLMMGYANRIGISGMHGKSTCTSMCAMIFMAANTDPTVLSGAELSSMGGAYRIGRRTREHFIFEACEYMDSFLDFNPTVAVVLNIEMDHVDYFKSMEHIKRSYASFADIVGENGKVLANADDPEVRAALADTRGELVLFGIDNPDSMIKAENIVNNRGKYSFDLKLGEEKICNISLAVSGYHNIYNALAAAGAALMCKVDAEAIKKGLEAFFGASRRMEYKGTQNNADVYDDYAHHPTEIRATLNGARGLIGEGGRLFCVFQSHTYSRTAALLDQFCDSLSLADEVLVCDIYAAREENVFGITPEKVAERIKGARACHGFDEPAEILRKELRGGDVAIIMGAGDVWKVLDRLDLKPLQTL